MKAKFLLNKMFTPVSPLTGTSAIRESLLSKGYLVVMENDELKGILTPENLIKSPYNLVLDCIQPRPTIDENDPIDAVFECMKSSGYNVLPVFSGHNFIGTISQIDIAEYLSAYRNELERQVSDHTAELKTVNDKLRKEEDALRISEERYRTMMEAMTDPVVICSDAHVILYVNPAMIRRLGKNVTGETCYKALHGLDHLCEWCAMDNIGETIPLEYTILSPRDHRHYRVTNTPICNRNGSTSMMAIFRDMTDYLNAVSEKKKAMLQLQNVQKMEAVGTFAGGIAHDFNNILSIIKGNASILVDHFSEDDDLYGLIADILTGIEQAQTLTRQLMAFSKGGAPVKTTVDLNELIRKTASFSIRGAKAECRFELTADVWPVDADPGQFNQIIGNLVINAGQSMPEGGPITLTSENMVVDAAGPLPLAPGRYVKVTITDQGSGIAEQNLPHIFDPFFTTKKTGTGLGLATTYSIVIRHHGHIEVSSVKDRGTTFRLYLPASNKTLTAPVARQDERPLGKGRILVMDDQEPVLSMMGNMLNHMGYEASLAGNGFEAITLFRKAREEERPYDVVILDLVVPGGLDGKDTLVELKKIDPHVTAIISSGYSNDSTMVDPKAHGFAGIIPKPFSKNHLLELFNRLMGPKLADHPADRA